MNDEEDEEDLSYIKRIIWSYLQSKPELKLGGISQQKREGDVVIFGVSLDDQKYVFKITKPRRIPP